MSDTESPTPTPAEPGEGEVTPTEIDEQSLEGVAGGNLCTFGPIIPILPTLSLIDVCTIVPFDGPTISENQ